MKTTRTLFIAATISLTFLLDIALAVPIPDSIFYGRVLGEDGNVTPFTEVAARLHGAASVLDPESGEEQNPIITRSGIVVDEELGEIYVLRIPRDDGAGLDNKDRLAAMAGDKLYILVDGEVVDETTLDGIAVTAAVSDVQSMNLNGPDCQNLADCDEDGLDDAWEQQIIDADPNDGITSIEDVNGADNFDGDELTNLQEFQGDTNPTVPENGKPVDTSGPIYEIIAFDYKSCLEAANVDTTVAHLGCDNSTSQSWRFEATSGGLFQISSVESQNCLTVAEVAIPEGAGVTQATCTGVDTQLWSVEREGDLYEIVSAHNGHCLTATIPNAAGTGDILEASCEAEANPEWVLFPKNMEIVYEDAEDELTTDWRRYAGDAAGASVKTVDDADLQSKVIEFSGSGTDNGYWLSNEDSSPWRNFSHSTISWDMLFSEPFVVYIDVETTAGHRYLYYTHLDRDVLGDGGSIHHGLGSHRMDGQWHTITRDLKADLHDAEPDVDLLEVNGFLIRGSGRIDNIKLTFKVPGITVYEDAEDGSKARWHHYYGDPVVGLIANVDDAVQGSKVIALSGAGMATGYRLRKADGSKWKNSSEFNISWDMQFSEAFKIFVDLETTAGHRYLYYTHLDTDLLGDEEYVQHGLGSHRMNGEWQTITRDLEADLHEAQPDVDLLEVNGFLIRGSGRIDNIQLQKRE